LHSPVTNHLIDKDKIQSIKKRRLKTILLRNTYVRYIQLQPKVTTPKITEDKPPNKNVDIGTEKAGGIKQKGGKNTK